MILWQVSRKYEFVDTIDKTCIHLLATEFRLEFMSVEMGDVLC